MLTIEQITATLNNHLPQNLEPAGAKHAAVAMLLTNSATGPEVLLIRRSEYDGDPWSGDVAFPGGGIEPKDRGPQQAAERETLEEIGLQLKPENRIGQLDDLFGAYLPIRISCFVYLLGEKPQLQLNGEVVDTFWVPLEQLLNPQRRKLASFEYRGTVQSHPIIELKGYCDRFLWGITYRLLENFFSLPNINPNCR